MADKGQKTDQPSERRLKKAREEGQFLTSRAFVNGIQLGCFVALISAFGGEIQGYLARSMRVLLRAAFESELTIQTLPVLLIRALNPGLPLTALCVAALLAVSLGAQFAVTGLGVSWKGMAPNLARLGPAGKWNQIKRQNFGEAVQAAILIPVVLWTVWLMARNSYAEFLTLPLASIQAAASRVAGSAQSLLWKAALVFFVFGVVDLLRQHRLYIARLKMSKQEIKDEHKETEGNPQLKARIRRLQRDAARRNMMKAIPQATAVVVNPTHYAIAIEYRMESMGAPKILAKGKNYLALRIKQKAEALQIPIVENPPLAQALYKSTDVGQEIPPHLYRAVAEVLAYIFRLMHQG